MDRRALLKVLTERMFVRAFIPGFLKRHESDSKLAHPDLAEGIFIDNQMRAQRLELLDPERATLADVTAALGYDPANSYIDSRRDLYHRFDCDQCGERVPAIVEIANLKQRAGSRGPGVCYRCAVQAMTAFDVQCEHTDCVENPTTIGRECARRTLGEP